MASNNPLNYANMPMGSHATAGGPHTPVSPQLPVSPQTPTGTQGVQGMQGIQGMQGASQGPTPGSHTGMPANLQVPMHQMPIPQMPLQQTPMQQFPTGQPQMPTVPMMQMPQLTGAAPVDFDVLGPVPVMGTEYTQGYLRTQIGKKVKVEFLIGADNYMDRQGTLVDVGISYIIITETETDDLVLCDIYSIKFVRFYY